LAKASRSDARQGGLDVADTSRTIRSEEDGSSPTRDRPDAFTGGAEVCTVRAARARASGHQRLSAAREAPPRCRVAVPLLI